MKKVLFTLNINDYSKEITDKTYPFLLKYAQKIGAEFQIISSRKFPKFPLVYEKLQIYELGKDNDWNIYVDSDALIHPDTFDITEFLPQDTVMTCKSDFAPIRFKYDNNFKRDGRNIGVGNWFTVASGMCIDLWHPLDIPLEESVKNIYPTIIERNSDISREHLIDDYTLSRNIAKFGLKYMSFVDMLKTYNNPGEFLFHEYCYTDGEKLNNINHVLDMWRGLT